jgi:hypothetical protein
MSTVNLQREFQASRNRLTSAFRPVLVLPLVFVEQAWSGLAQILGLIQWFIIVVTGRRNEDIFLLQR